MAETPNSAPTTGLSRSRPVSYGRAKTTPCDARRVTRCLPSVNRAVPPLHGRHGKNPADSARTPLVPRSTGHAPGTGGHRRASRDAHRCPGSGRRVSDLGGVRRGRPVGPTSRSRSGRRGWAGVHRRERLASASDRGGSGPDRGGGAAVDDAGLGRGDGGAGTSQDRRPARRACTRAPPPDPA